MNVYVCCSGIVKRNSNKKKRRGTMKRKEKKLRGKEIHVDASLYWYSFS